MKAPSGLLVVTQFWVSTKAKPGRDKGNHDRDLDDDDDVVDPGRFVDADDQKGRHRHDDEHGRNIEDGAGAAPDAGRRVIGKRRACELVGDRDAEVAEEADDVAGPADGDGGRADRVFEDQVPADDPGDELAQRRIGIGVGAAGNRDDGGHLRVAEAGKGAGKAAKHEGECDGRAGVGRRRHGR